jgi:tetratricopeptide (TPR) repeat protein
MKPESLVFGVAGAFLGLIAGWLIGSQQPSARTAAPVAQQAAAPASAPANSAATNKVVLDEAEVKRLKDICEKDPSNATPRTQLGNLYFDAERYPDAIEWYTKALELDPGVPASWANRGTARLVKGDFRGTIDDCTKALELDPTNPDVSTDLGVSYYYQNQPDKALAQFKHSLEIDPKHSKTMLNQGIVLAFGKQDLEGAAKSWQQVVDLTPTSPEGQAAKRALDSLKGAHPNLNAGTAAAPGTD